MPAKQPAPFSTATSRIDRNPYLATGTGVFLCSDCGQQVHTLRNLGDRWVCVGCWHVKTLRKAPN